MIMGMFSKLHFMRQAQLYQGYYLLSIVRSAREMILVGTLFIFLIGVGANAQTTSDKIIIDGKTFYLHKVAKGEGFYRIGKVYGVSQKEIVEANPDAVFGLKEGQLLKVPVIAGRNSTQDEINKSDAFIYHTVEQGQTVYYISRKYDVPLEVIYENNPGSQSQLLQGSIIKIPNGVGEAKEEVDKEDDKFVYHKVMPKETLYALCRQYNSSEKEVIENNPALQNGILSVGSVIRIPRHEGEENVVVDSTADTTDQVIEDELYIYHRIAVGETMYSIAKAYRAVVNEVIQANQDVDSNDLPVGYLMRIPKSSLKGGLEKDFLNDDTYFTVHKVKRKESIFGISKKYGVDADIIERINSEVDFAALKKGTELKIPTQKWFEDFYHFEEVASQEKEVDDADLAFEHVSCIGYDYAATRPALRVGVLLPFAVEETKRMNIISGEEQGVVVAKSRENKILSNKSKVFVEFYEGVLMALDSMKANNVNVELFVFDTAPDTNKVKAILARPEVAHLDLIIGPAYAHNLPLVSDFAASHQIKMVYPFSTINPEIDHNPYLFQASPVDSLLFDVMADKMLQGTEGKRVIMIRTPNKKSSYENQFSKKIREKIYLESFSFGQAPDFMEYNFVPDDLVGLERIFADDRENVVIIPSVEEAHVNRIVTSVAGVADRKKCDISLWGLSEWLRFQTIDPEYMHQLNSRFFSFYGMDYEDEMTQSFVTKYREWYETEPMAISPYFQRASVNSNFSRYGIWGYDITMYFLGAMKEFGPQFEHCIANYNPHLVQSNFYFTRYSNWGGFYNSGLLLLHFTPDLKLEVERLHIQKN
ncbi:LysM peptidoglycan-binding domain-containing protein [Marinilabiliaceae bacterium JC017]|nr:LysM peptidoglycan-binding domain-containing protein [Marinilabiliaceae bacterium JC017]